MEVVGFRVFIYFNQKELLFYFSFTISAVSIKLGCDNTDKATISSESNWSWRPVCLYFLNNSTSTMDISIKGMILKEQICLLLWKQSQEITVPSLEIHQTFTWEILLILYSQQGRDLGWINTGAHVLNGCPGDMEKSTNHWRILNTTFQIDSLFWTETAPSSLHYASIPSHWCCTVSLLEWCRYHVETFQLMYFKNLLTCMLCQRNRIQDT